MKKFVLIIFITSVIFGVVLFVNNRKKDTYTEQNTYMTQETQEVSQSESNIEIRTLPSEKILPGINQVYQTFNNCGPAALSMLLSYFDINVSQKQLGEELRPYQNPTGDNDDKSVTLEELAEKSKEYGFIPYHRPAGNFDMLERLIQINIPIITRTWLTTDESIGHFRVVKGYNNVENYIIQDDSYQGPDKRYSYAEFNELWKKFNYEYLILVPLSQKDEVENILGDYVNEEFSWKESVKIALEQLELNQNDIFARINLSVAYYHLGEYQKSIEEFEKVEDSIPFRTLWYQIEPILAYYEIGNYERVFEITNNILNNGNRAYSELYEIRGNIYLKQDKEDLAQQEFQFAEKYKNTR